MPCSVDPVYVDYTKVNAEVLDNLNYLTHQLDIVREDILAGKTPNLTFMIKFGDYNTPYDARSSGPTRGVDLDTDSSNHLSALVAEGREYMEVALSGKEYDMDTIYARQVKHRAEDISRLIKHFLGEEDFEMISKLSSVDFSKPLEPQLGFDPDEY